MTEFFENRICYFCDEIYPFPPSYLVANYYGIWICNHCDEFVSPLKYTIKENGECPICYENTELFELSRCTHKICLECCKTIYFGKATTERPIHYRENLDEEPIWPYETENQEEYMTFELNHFDWEKTYDELIITRNQLIPERPSWMNTDAFINYENNYILWSKKCAIIDNEWEKYNESKTKGNGSCPLCRQK